MNECMNEWMNEWLKEWMKKNLTSGWTSVGITVVWSQCTCVSFLQKDVARGYMILFILWYFQFHWIIVKNK